MDFTTLLVAGKANVNLEANSLECDPVTFSYRTSNAALDTKVKWVLHREKKTCLLVL